MSSKLQIKPLSNITLPSEHLHAQSNSRNTRVRCKTCSKLTIKTPERRLTLNIFRTFV